MPTRFRFTTEPIDPAAETTRLADPGCGGFASFEGWVREENDGQRVLGLTYEAYVELAEREGERILDEALRRFGVRQLSCVHRLGELGLGELAVYVGAAAPHRAEAFAACRYVIDEVKHRVPIWKKEHYVGGDSGWVNCERCAQPSAVDGHAPHAHHGHAAGHAHPDSGDRLPASDYTRQQQLPEVGARGQAALRRARVLVVGAGGLGVPALAYLAGAGIGTLGIMDGDLLEASNLHRQTLYAIAEVGRPKALLAAERVRALNPEVDVRPYVHRADAGTLGPLLSQFDLVLDCTDNFAATYAIHDAARAAGVTAIYASVYQYEGQLQTVRGGDRGSCLRCVWPQATPDGLVGNCAASGVLGPVPGVLGNLQALEALKLLLGLPGALEDELLLVDLLGLSMQRIRAPRHCDCRDACVREPARVPEGAAVELAADDLDTALPPGYQIIDIREAAELAALACPLPSLHVPMRLLLDDPAQLPADRDSVLICARGSRSLAAARALRARGADRVWSVTGGVEALGSRAIAPG